MALRFPPLDRSPQALLEINFRFETDHVPCATGIKTAARLSIGFRVVPLDATFEPGQLDDEFDKITDNVNLFTPPTNPRGAATILEVNAAVVADTNLLAASSTAGGIPGNGIGAQALAELEFENVAGGNSRKLSASVNQILTNLGYSVRDADQAEERTSLRLRQLTNLRESSSGVSIEEEMIQLTRYQRSFQAASKIVSAVDDMLGIVLSISKCFGGMGKGNFRNILCAYNTVYLWLHSMRDAGMAGFIFHFFSRVLDFF